MARIQRKLRNHFLLLSLSPQPCRAFKLPLFFVLFLSYPPKRSKFLPTYLFEFMFLWQVWKIMICIQNYGSFAQALLWKFLEREREPIIFLRVTWNKYEIFFLLFLPSLGSSSCFNFFKIIFLEQVRNFLASVFLQLQASTNQELNQQLLPNFNLPSKILCRVVNVQLLVLLLDSFVLLPCLPITVIWMFFLISLLVNFQAEPETDEVYARIALLPESDVRIFLSLYSFVL